MRSPMSSDITSAPHRIQRQVIELALPPGMAAPESLERLAREWRDRVLPALSNVFDATVGADRMLRLDRLELDLGTVTGSDWAPRLGERLLERIAEELARHPVSMAATSPGASNAASEPMRALMFFLEHGRLPWWGDRPDGGFSAILTGPGAIAWPALRAVLRDAAPARVRLVESLDDAQLAAGVMAWRGVPTADDVLRALTPADAAPSAARAWRRGFWRILVAWAVQGASNDATAPPIAPLLAAHREVFGAPSMSRQYAWNPSTVTTPRDGDGDADADAALPPAWRDRVRGDRDAPPTRPTPDSRPLTEHAAASSLQTPESKRRQPTPTMTDDTPIYLPGAGIVLLHPFLPALFRDRDLLGGSAGSDGAAFRDSAAQSHAVQLLGLLGFGAVDVPEYDLVLPKRLCGHPLADALEPSTLGPDDVAACDELLAAVLGHWRALRSSSADWLRSQFLLRDGRLDDVGGGCRLTVERRAQDVLLARLPWGIGVIGLPWLAERIFVRWID